MVILRLRKRIANPGRDCRTGKGNTKCEIRNAKYEDGASSVVRGGYWVGYTLSYRDVMAFGAVAAGVAGTRLREE